MTSAVNSSKRNIIFALMVATFLTAIDTTVISTAMPAIARDLGGSELISWVFSIYLLTTAATTPIYGKLADLFGRKRIFIFGAAVFLVGSFLCGLSGSMTQLMIFRAVQGLGAGAVQPMTLTIIGDVFTQEERARLMGLFSAMWGVAGIVGPLVGGFFVDYISWEWIFYINIPVGLVSIILIYLFFHEKLVSRQVSIDYAGAALFTLSIGTFLYTLLEGGERSGIALEPVTFGLLIGSALLFLLFLRVEKKVAEPMLPIQLFRRPLIAVSQIVSFIQGAILIGSSAYLPIWIQDVQGHSATFAGLAVLPMSLGWPIAASVGGRMLIKAGYKLVTVVGMATLVLATFFLSLLTPDSPVWAIPIAVFVLGVGFGFATTSVTIAVQSSVAWQQRGIVTGALQFMRTIGQTVGVALLGAVLNWYLAQSGSSPLAHGLMGVFTVMMGTALLGFALSWLLPREAEQAEPES
ncbi:MFS transporter [Brevibacillus humidisoli]|uniref:MDR family MFS transporter n=1 Tax=Brevibacillus humidisoli TaxID=2895522 RepID=UPI001E62FAB6|nr:MDR family MFS transporter [Brevibacillus humidisoli]UFJ41226.1 MFS transporter [Brevibacillus humidisoli]